ncbi:MAG: Phage tail sheath protein, partial [Collimonas fungivorans]
GSEWTYVSVRRLFIYVEQSLKQSLQWVVFEPNDQQTWASVTRDISAFLTTLWQSGGLFGASAAEAFFVTCDASNNPPETRSLGQLYIDVGLAPVFPAEFVIIRMTQKIAGPDSGS